MFFKKSFMFSSFMFIYDLFDVHQGIPLTCDYQTLMLLILFITFKFFFWSILVPVLVGFLDCIDEHCFDLLKWRLSARIAPHCVCIRGVKFVVDVVDRLRQLTYHHMVATGPTARMKGCPIHHQHIPTVPNQQFH